MRFPTALVLYMFYFDSTIKAIEMHSSTAAIGAVIACLIAASSHDAIAQDATGITQAASNDGFRVAIQSDGFQLVEHGFWNSIPRPGRPSPSDEVGGGVSAARHPKLDQNRPSGFRRAAYLSQVYAAEAQFALPPGLLDALVWTESRYNPFAVSKAGAVGLGQLMPGTARDLGIANRYDPETNIVGAARYLRQMIDKFGVVHLALAAYNAGPRAVQRAGGIPRNGETPAYVRNVLQSWRF